MLAHSGSFLCPKKAKPLRINVPKLMDCILQNPTIIMTDNILKKDQKY